MARGTLLFLSSSRRRPGPSGAEGDLFTQRVRDRVAQSAVTLLLTPLLDQEFEDSSYGYRPGRSVKQAVEHVRRLRNEGYEWTVDADIEKYFDNIPHEKPLKELAFFLASNTGKTLTYQKLKTMLGLASGTTVAQYCQYLENSYLFFFIWSKPRMTTP